MPPEEDIPAELVMQFESQNIKTESFIWAFVHKMK